MIEKKWSVVYEKAIKDDGSLFFPQRLNHDFLDGAEKTLGSMLFANQYLNEVFPAKDAKFKKEWFKYYDELPNTELYTFAHIDPAISTEDGADYTGISVVSVDNKHNWYLRHASRSRLTPTQIVDKVFQLQREFQCHGIGVESVAYQKALIYMITERFNEANTLPLKEIKRGPQSNKEMRIMRLIPRMEWGKFYHRREMYDFEKELLQFPKSAHDDIIDAVTSLEEIVFYPANTEVTLEPGPHDPRYESKIIQGYYKRDDGSQGGDYGGFSDDYE